MYEHELRELRRSIEEGEPLDGGQVGRALDALDALHRRIGTPTELHLSALVDPQRPDTWRVTHPLLRGDATAANAADAVILAAAELRDHLDAADGTPLSRTPWRQRTVDRATWDAHAAGAEPVAASLRGALARIDGLEAELGELRDRLHDRHVVRGAGSSAEREQARARMRAASRARLASCNVEGVDREWRSHAFGELADHGVPEPVLVLASRASIERSTHVDHRFTADRRWLAVEHRCSDGVGSDHLTAVVTPLDTGMDVHRRLGRLAQLVGGRGSTIGHLTAYRDVVAELFGAGVRVDARRGPVGGGCWPFDLSSLPAVANLSVDDVEDWTTPDDGQWFTLGPHWELWLLGPSPTD